MGSVWCRVFDRFIPLLQNSFLCGFGIWKWRIKLNKRTLKPDAATLFPYKTVITPPSCPSTSYHKRWFQLAAWCNPAGVYKYFVLFEIFKLAVICHSAMPSLRRIRGGRGLLMLIATSDKCLTAGKHSPPVPCHIPIYRDFHVAIEILSSFFSRHQIGMILAFLLLY